MARAAYGIQRADLLPSVGVSAGMTRIGVPDNLGVGLPPSVAAMVPSTLTSYSASVGISSWELDLWGRVRNLSDAALRQYFAAAWARQGAEVSRRSVPGGRLKACSMNLGTIRKNQSRTMTSGTARNRFI